MLLKRSTRTRLALEASAGPCAAALATLLGCAELSVAPPAPVADGGFDQLRFLRGEERLQVDLDGRASCDPLGPGAGDPLGARAGDPLASGSGDPLAARAQAPWLQAAWSVVAAPPSARAQLSETGLRATLEVDRPGDYVVALSVRAGDRTSETDYVTIRIESGDGEDLVVQPPSTNACGEPL